MYTCEYTHFLYFSLLFTICEYFFMSVVFMPYHSFGYAIFNGYIPFDSMLILQFF
jgi:hypothetical protein